MSYYDEIEIEDMEWDAERGLYHYPCPCGDRFEISRKELSNPDLEVAVATCPSCSLVIKVIYDFTDFMDDDGGAKGETPTINVLPSALAV